MSIGFVPLKRVSDMLHEHAQLSSMRHIKINVVNIVDHLGRTLLVPTLFCSTWQVSMFGFHSVLDG